MSVLAGFPNDIKVVLGSAWTEQVHLDESDIILLQKRSGVDEWTEDGTTTANSTNNRLYFKPSSFTASHRINISGCNNTNNWKLAGEATVSPIETPSAAQYDFPEIWSRSGFFVASSDGSFWTTAAYPTDYNSAIFSALQAAAVGDVNVLEGATPIPDGTTTPRDFGSVIQGDAVATKTFTVENLGELTVSITSITLPTGYAFNGSSQLTGGANTIAGGTSKTLIVDLQTSVLGTKSGDITINSDDADEAAYNWAITGVVSLANTNVNGQEGLTLGVGL